MLRLLHNQNAVNNEFQMPLIKVERHLTNRIDLL